jgi:RNA-binding protein 39
MIDESKMQHIDESDIRKYFDGYGTIDLIDIPRDHITLKPKGYVLIEFSRCSEAKDAVSVLNGFEIDGKKINV